jgi:hypothetical protein
VEPVVMPPPIVATSPDQNLAREEIESDPVKSLQTMFPMIEIDQIQTFLELNGGNVKKTARLIREQLNIEIVDEEDQIIDPEDVEFNMLAGGQMDPNAITEEERKMIEKAIRESEAQEQRVHQAASNSRAQVQNAQARLAQQQQNIGQINTVEQQQKQKKDKKQKTQKKVSKKDGNNC